MTSVDRRDRSFPTAAEQVAVVVLAAGSARRMGAPKLLMEVGARPIIARVLDAVAATGLRPVVIVLPPGPAALHSVVARHPLAASGTLAIVVNPDPERGMSSSLRVGVKALPSGVQAAFIVLGDQPFLSADVFRRLLNAYRSRRGEPGNSRQPLITAPVYGDVRGHPVLFDRLLFPSLLEASGDEGGRGLLQQYRDRTLLVPIPDEWAALDVDTPDDLARARRRESP